MHASQPTKVIPRFTAHQADLKLGSRRMTIGLNLAAILLLFFWGWLFLRLAFWLRPSLLIEGSNLFALNTRVPWPVLLGAVIGVLVLHELVHGFFFWHFTGERPRFGVGPLHFYAAAPDWYLPRNQFVVVALAPLLILSLAGFILLALLPIAWLPALLLALIVNASGAVGDLYVVARLLPAPRRALVQDTGSTMAVYTPIADVADVLNARWQSLCRDFGLDPARCRALFADLSAYYTADRHYHNLAHIHQMLELADRFGSQVRHRAALELAIWYHDIIYDPLASDNEARSAAYLEQAMGDTVPADVMALAVDHINATTHVAVPQNADTRLLLDLDLASFANNRENYERDVAAIRQEFAMVPADQFRAGRRRILSRFLDRPRLYVTETLAHLEKAARANIRHELAALQE